MNLEVAKQKSEEAYKRKGREFFYNSAIGRVRKGELDALFAGGLETDRDAGLKLLVLAQLTMQFESMAGNQYGENDRVSDETLVEMAEKTYQEMENG